VTLFSWTPSLKETTHHRQCTILSSNIIKEIVDPSFARKSLQRSFGRSFHGFALNPVLMLQKLTALQGDPYNEASEEASMGLQQNKSKITSKILVFMIFPDVTAPGVEILAAFSPKAALSGYPIDNRYVEYNILSGTSMACPHVTAAAAYVKSFHPRWSAIKSALMTTAWKFFDGLHPEAEFAYGSGHINALMETDPGLVYETPFEEYLKVGCNISPTTESLIAPNASCPSDGDINYPSMADLVDMQSFVVSFPRIVTNVSQANSTYVVAIDGELSDLRISVEPSTLQFTALHENLGFVVTVRGKRMKPLTMRRASLVWTDGVHKVHTSLVLYRLNTTSGGEKAKALDEFISVSGLIPNLSKYSTSFWNVKAKVKAAIYYVMPFDAGVKYLEEQGIVISGRLLLIKSVMSSIQVYWSSMFMLPKSMIYEIDDGFSLVLWLKDGRMVRNFLDVPELRNLLRGHVVHRLGDGTSTVADVVENGEWKRPAIWYVKFPFVAHLPPPFLFRDGQDIVLWKSKNGKWVVFLLRVFGMFFQKLEMV
ncbi:subtilisin-like protease SBT4.3, partial [Tanacetum coccineum]